MAFEWYDWVIFSIFLGSSLVVGFFVAWKNKSTSTSDFMTASKSLSWLPVTISLFASFTSAITLISTPSDIYKSNTDYIFILMPWLIGAVLSANTGWLESFYQSFAKLVIFPSFVPLTFLPKSGFFYLQYHISRNPPFKYFKFFYRLDLTSSYEYLMLRFGSYNLRRFITGMFMIQSVITMGISLYAPSLAFSAANDDADVWIFVVAAGVICTVYTTARSKRFDVLPAEIWSFWRFFE